MSRYDSSYRRIGNGRSHYSGSSYGRSTGSSGSVGLGRSLTAVIVAIVMGVTYCQKKQSSPTHLVELPAKGEHIPTVNISGKDMDKIELEDGTVIKMSDAHSGVYEIGCSRHNHETATVELRDGTKVGEQIVFNDAGDIKVTNAGELGSATVKLECTGERGKVSLIANVPNSPTTPEPPTTTLS